MKLLFLLLTTLCSFHTFAQMVTIDTVIVKPYKSVQNYEHFRRMVIIASDPEIEFLEGYNFEWGVEKKILVETTKLNETLSDGTRYDHKYIRTISELKMDSTDTFIVSLNGELYYGGSTSESSTLKILEAGKYRYFDEVNIIVPKLFLSKITRIKNAKMTSRGVFVYVDRETIRLVGFL